MENPERNYWYETELSYFWFVENDLLWVRSKDVPRTFEKQKRTFELLKSMMGNNTTGMVLDMTDCSMIMFDEKTREYIAWTLPLMFRAVAVVAKTTLQKVGPTIFLNTVDLSIPMEIFEEEDEATEWLKRQPREI